MNDTINRQAAIDAAEKLLIGICGITEQTITENNVNRFCAEIMQLPSAQPEPPKGEWIKKKGNLYCSKCGTKALFRMDKKILDYDYCESNFCPNCGTNMRGK